MIKKIFVMSLLMLASLFFITIAYAQSAFEQGDIIQIPSDLSVDDAVLKVSTWLMAVFIFLSARFSHQLPFLQRVSSKWFLALSIAIAIGFVLFKMGLTTGNQAVLAFVGSSAFHEFLKVLVVKDNPTPQPSEHNIDQHANS